tara:strand:- start:576 stop:767 length:192 start_codon:yes stop_codon:yes gene_type:complete
MSESNKELTKTETAILSKLNVRALKLVEIYDHFHEHKIRVDKAYLDSLSDEKIDEIYKNYVGK